MDTLAVIIVGGLSLAGTLWCAFTRAWAPALIGAAVLVLVIAEHVKGL